MNTYPHRVGLAICVPHTGRALPPMFAWALAGLSPPMNFNTRFLSNIDGSGKVHTGEVDYLRNWFIRQAIEQDCELIFFLDEDVTPPQHTLRQLIYQMQHRPKAAIVGGVYCSKTIPTFPMTFRGNGGGSYWDWKAGECFEVSGIGLGCALVRVAALKDLADPWCQTLDNAEGLFDAIPSLEAWTEDLNLCDKLTEAGWEIWADSAVLATHWDLATMKPYRLDRGSNPMQMPVIPEDEPRRLLLTTVDGETTAYAGLVDYRCDAGMLPFESQNFNEVIVELSLEQFYPHDLPHLFSEWIRVLRPGATITLTLAKIDKLPVIVPPTYYPTNKLINETTLLAQIRKVALLSPKVACWMLMCRGLECETTEQDYTWTIKGKLPL